MRYRRRWQATVVRGDVKLLYVAPERLVSPAFLHLLSTRHISFHGAAWRGLQLRGAEAGSCSLDPLAGDRGIENAQRGIGGPLCPQKRISLRSPS